MTQQSLWLDEVDALAFAQQDLSALLLMMVSPAQNGGLFYLLLKGWLAVAGVSEFTLRFASVLPSVLVIPLVYVLGRRLLSAEAGFWAALLAATSPYLFFYAQEGKMYALYACLSVTAMYLFLTGLETGTAWRWAAYAGVTVAGVYVHLFFGFLVAAQHAIAPLLGRDSRAGLRGWYVTQTLLALPVLPLALWEIPAALWGYPTAFAPQPFESILQVLFLRFTLHTETWPSPFVLLPFVTACVAALTLPLPRDESGRPSRLLAGERRSDPEPRRRGGAVFLTLWLVVPVAAYYLVSFHVPAFMHRYFTLAAPAYYLLMGVGIAALRGRWPFLGLLCAAGILGAWAAVTARPSEVRPDFRSAAAFVTARVQPGDALVFVAEYGERVFAFYAPQHPPVAGAPYTNDDAPPEAALAALAQQVAPYRRVWLVLFEDWLWDGRQLTRGWLERHGSLTASATFPGVTVLAYSLGG